MSSNGEVGSKRQSEIAPSPEPALPQELNSVEVKGESLIEIGDLQPPKEAQANNDLFSFNFNADAQLNDQPEQTVDQIVKKEVLGDGSPLQELAMQELVHTDEDQRIEESGKPVMTNLWEDSDEDDMTSRNSPEKISPKDE